MQNSEARCGPLRTEPKKASNAQQQANTHEGINEAPADANGSGGRSIAGVGVGITEGGESG